MTLPSYAVFSTEIGPCGIAWGDRGILGLQLPEVEPAQARARMLRRFPGAREAAPPAPIQATIDGIVDLLSGGPADLSAAPLDMERVPPFHRRVYEIARSIPPGSTLSYGEVAERLGDRTLARAVGQALGENPFPIVVPCHRVLAAGGRSGGFSAPGGVSTKLRLLSIEGARANGVPTLFD
jgi:methylated-DNA-[protein]-cysteine S-methyltransferase